MVFLLSIHKHIKFGLYNNVIDGRLCFEIQLCLIRCFSAHEGIDKIPAKTSQKKYGGRFDTFSIFCVVYPLICFVSPVTHKKNHIIANNFIIL